MGFIVTAVLLAIGILFHKKNKTFACPETFFCYEWALISFLSSIRLFGLYSVGIGTWAIILVGSCFYVLGCVCGKKIIALDSRKERENDCAKPFKLSYYYYVSIILLIISVYQFIPSFRLLMQGYSLDEIRLASYNIIEIEGFSGVTSVGEYVNLIKSTLEIFVIAYGIERFVIDFKRNYSCIIPVVLIILFDVFSNGGRFVIAYFVLELLVCFSIYKKKGVIDSKKINKKLRNVIFIFVASAALLTVLVTIMRGAEIGEIIKKYYRYTCGNTVLLDYHVVRLNENNIFSYSFGGLYGFWSFILPIFHKIGFAYPDVYLYCIDNVMVGQNFVQVGTDMYTNAFLSSFYCLYADFRIFGVIAGMLFFGAFCGILYGKAVNSKRPLFTVTYLIAAQMIFKTLQEYFLSSAQYFLPFIVIAVIFIVYEVRNVKKSNYPILRKGKYKKHDK